MNIVGAEEIKRLHPLINADGIQGAIYTEGDGHIDPSSVTQTFASKARELGAKVFEHSEVVGLQCMPNGTWEVTVRATNGESHVVRAQRVVNCAGLWAERVGEFAGVHTPCVVLQHQYVI